MGTGTGCRETSGVAEIETTRPASSPGTRFSMATFLIPVVTVAGEPRDLEGRVSGHLDQQAQERRGADADGLLRGRRPHRPRGAHHYGARLRLRGADQQEGEEKQAHDGE